LSILPADCVVISQRSHRYASFFRLATERIFCGIMLKVNGTAH